MYPDKVSPVVELWSTSPPRRLAFVSRADVWPEGKYVVNVETKKYWTTFDGSNKATALQIQGTLEEAKAMAVALATIDN